MERFQVAIALSLTLLMLLAGGCANPFAPALSGNSESLWTDASTVGGLLKNFSTAYQLGDSLQYADLLDEQFQFQYYDPNLQRTDGWYRDTDLRATSRMFRSFHDVSLIWGGLTPADEAISAPDSMIEIRVQYQLILDELSPLLGFARFTVFKPRGGKFRIVLWRDDF
ncbi:MAG TPA: hypothetical protein VGL38_05790 [bacterium]|jgi:hypothetical protein